GPGVPHKLRPGQPRCPGPLSALHRLQFCWPGVTLPWVLPNCPWKFSPCPWPLPCTVANAVAGTAANPPPSTAIDIATTPAASFFLKRMDQHLRCELVRPGKERPLEFRPHRTNCVIAVR